ncbi:hypothetical protein O3P69_013699 [Scylla paramamosain]|uniref:Monocarboxylate transporter n=2 Tax=Scylla paramamosain TaxID=85552 RepID=A0AAW0SQH6_SCYPA
MKKCAKGLLNNDYSVKNKDDAQDDDVESCVEEEKGPDGGWGWVVVFACFMLWIIIGSAPANFGILFSGFLTGLQTSSIVTAWIQNLGMVLSALGCYLVDPMVEEFGWRNVSLAMGVMMALGMSLSAAATSAVDLFFTYSVLSSIPVEIIMTVTHAIVPHYFTQRMTLACSLTSCGSSISLIVMPPLLTMLIEQYSFRGATLITGALMANTCVAAMVFHPIEWHSNIRPSKTVAQKVEGGGACSRVFNSIGRMLKTARGNLWLFRSMRAILINIILSIAMMAFSNFLYLVPFAMEAEGYSPEESSLSISVSGFSLLVTRFIYPILLIRFGVKHQIGVMSSLAICGTAVIVFAWEDNLYVKLAMMAVQGVGVGMFFTSYCLVVVEVLGLSLLTPMLSINGVFKASITLLLGPLIGWIRDVTGSYPVSLSVLAGTFYLATGLWFVLPLARNYDLSHEDQTKKFEQFGEMESKKKEQQQKNDEKLSLLEGIPRQGDNE